MNKSGFMEGFSSIHKGVTFIVHPLEKKNEHWFAVSVIIFPDGIWQNLEDGKTKEEAMANAKRSAIKIIEEKAH